MRKIIKIITGLLISITILGALTLFYLQNGREMKVYSSHSFQFDNYHTCTLNIILNQLYISDENSCAEEILDHCKNNTFKNILFSYDASIPNELNITVYLSERHLKNHTPSFSFTYTQTSTDECERYNILEHPEQFQITFIS